MILKATNAFVKIADLIENKKYKTLVISFFLFIVFCASTGLIVTKISHLQEDITNVMINDKLMISDEKDNAINVILNDIRIRLEASRVFHTVYHNGMTSLDGIGFRRASVLHECKSEYLESYLSLMTNIPMSVFSYWNLKFREEGVVEYPNVDSVEYHDRGVYYIMKSYRIESAYFYSYVGSDREPKGFIGIEFVNQDRILTKEESKYINNAVQKLAGILYDLKTRG